MKNNSNKADFTAAFAQLRQRFALGLPQRSADMVSLVEQSNAKSKLGTLIAEAHKLAGACGTFGYAKLGTHARQIMQLAEAIKAKSADEQEQSLPVLKRAVLEFDIAVANAMQSQANADGTVTETILEANAIWLLLENPALVTELSHQLSAFGHMVEQFTDYDTCVRRLQSAAPAVLVSNVVLDNGQSVFNQTLLLNQLVKQQSRLILAATTDSFDLRIQAAQQRAEAFFVAPFDVPSMIATLTELLEHSASSSGRVFIVDDDRLLAEHYALVLNSIGIETRIIKNIRNIVDELVRFQPDLLLMDMYMPEYSGAELAGVIRQYRSLKRLPIVFLSSEANKLLQIRAMSHGADDFLTKPIDDHELAQVIKVRLARSKQIKNLIEKDSLTALIKHSAIKELAELEFERAGRAYTNLSIVMLDIDRFKAVNDRYGHATGDVVITALATLLRKRIRKTDRAGRYGGEEFMLVLPDCDALQAKALVEKILQAFRILHFTAGETQFYCTFSAGVASIGEGSFANAEKMIAAADDALYRAKNAGRNQICS